MEQRIGPSSCFWRIFKALWAPHVKAQTWNLIFMIIVAVSQLYFCAIIINKLYLDIHTLFSVKRNPQPPVTTWMDFEDIMINEMSGRKWQIPYHLTDVLGLQNKADVQTKQNSWIWRTEWRMPGGELCEWGWMHVGVQMYRLAVVERMSHEGVVCCSIVTIVGGIVVYIWNLLGERISKVLVTRQQNLCYLIWWWMMIRLIVVIISQCLQMWSHYVVYLKLT